jgi:hypothetical protein
MSAKTRAVRKLASAAQYLRSVSIEEQPESPEPALALLLALAAEIAAEPRKIWRAVIYVRELREALGVIIGAWWLGWRLRHTRIDPNAPCPGCGARNGSIRFDPNIVWPDGRKGAEVHTCAVCHAGWAEYTIVRAEAWRIDGYMEMEEARPDTPPMQRVVTSRQAAERRKPQFRVA